MKPLIAILTALHVLAHGVFGCCDHGVAALSWTERPCECHQAHHDHEHDHDQPQSVTFDSESIEEGVPSPAPHECFHSACHWVTGDASPMVDLFDASSAFSTLATVSMDIFSAQAAEIWPDAAAGTLSAPPLRLHLALGVILV